MKRIVVLTVFLFIAVACDAGEDPLTLDNAIDHLKSEGIEVTDIDADEFYEDYIFNMTLNGVKPKFFHVNGDQELSIYKFSSESELELGLEDLEYKTAAGTLSPHERYVVDNLLVFYIFLGQHTDKDSDIDAAIRGIE